MSAQPTNPKPMSTARAAEELGVCERSVRRYIEAGHLEAEFLPSGHARIWPHAIEDCKRRAREQREARREHRMRSARRRARAEDPSSSAGSSAPAQKPSEAPRRRRRKLLAPPPVPQSAALDLSPEGLRRLREQHAA